MEKRCCLNDEHLCIECGDCELCDINPDKHCDNCMECVKKYHGDYVAIEIDDVIESETEPEA